MRDRAWQRVQWVRGGSLAAIALSVLLLARVAPLSAMVDAARDAVAELGALGPVVLVAAYLACGLLLLPCWVLTVVAGALYGVVGGSLLVTGAATLTVAASILLARRVLRRRLERAVRGSRRLRALDAAITEGGWRVVALARLTPVLPFGVQNYLYGVSGIGFAAAVGTSAWAMLPGTVLYAYLGHLAAAGVAEREGAGGADGWVWTLRGVGLAAGVVGVVYLTRLSRRKLLELSPVGLPGDTAQEPTSMTDRPAPPPRFPFGTAALASLAIALLGGSVYAQFHPSLVRDFVAGALGPGAVAATEVFEEKPGGPTIDHSRFDAVLERVVTPDGSVDYRELRREPAAADLAAYVEQLGAITAAEFDALGRNEKLALLINAYNAFTLQLMLDHGVPASIRDIPEAERWKADRWAMAGDTFSLDEIEHGWLREKFIEPRIHFAVVCASVGCPPLRGEAFVGARVEEQLEEQARAVFVDGSRWFDYDAEAGELRLTELLKWFAGDFERVAGTAVDYAARYSPELKAAVDAGRRPEVRWIPYDWSINAPAGG